MNEPNPELPDNIKPPYRILKKTHKKDMEGNQLKKFMEMLKKIHVNIHFCEALKNMRVYAKFVKELLSGMCKLK